MRWVTDVHSIFFIMYIGNIFTVNISIRHLILLVILACLSSSVSVSIYYSSISLSFGADVGFNLVTILIPVQNDDSRVFVYKCDLIKVCEFTSCIGRIFS